MEVIIDWSSSCGLVSDSRKRMQQKRDNNLRGLVESTYIHGQRAILYSINRNSRQKSTTFNYRIYTHEADLNNYKKTTWILNRLPHKENVFLHWTLYSSQLNRAALNVCVVMSWISSTPFLFTTESSNWECFTYFAFQSLLFQFIH